MEKAKYNTCVIRLVNRYIKHEGAAYVIGCDDALITRPNRGRYSRRNYITPSLRRLRRLVIASGYDF